MKQLAGKIATFAVLALSLMLVVEAADTPKKSSPQSGSMTVWQARRAAISAMSQEESLLNTHNINTFNFSTVNPGTIRFAADSLEFDAVNVKKNKTEHARIDLNVLPALSVQCTFRGIYCRLKGGRGEEPAGLTLGDHRFELFFRADNGFCGRTPACMTTAETLAAALNRLRVYAKEAESRQRTFSQLATAWRALTEKPPIPEEVRVQRLLAEDAVKSHKPEEALDYYEAGLELYPTWPQGRFNAALIAAELGFYAEAIEHMQAYLELVPERADAQSARDQIVIWQHKTK